MKNLLLDLVQVSEEAAFAAQEWIGKNDPIAADNAAVTTMRNEFYKMNFKAKIVIGEGERDEAPMLHIGEVVGCGEGEIEYDIAVDPLECTNNCAKGVGGSMVSMVVAKRNMLLAAPDVYMKKIAAACEEIDLDASVAENLAAVSKAKGVEVSDLTVAILDRDRHSEIISEVLAAGAKVKLISDGDIVAAIMSCMPESGVDIYIGIGGAPEGVIAAAAISIIDGKMQGRLIFKNESQRERAGAMISGSIDRKFSAQEMSGNGELAFIITGVTSGELLGGVDHCTTDTICIYRDSSGKIFNRQILTNHY